jgi:hypothetical protein
MDCANCKTFVGELRDKKGSISILVMGDEYIYCYFDCQACGMYTAEQYHDRFIGDASIAVMAPIPMEVGEKILALIADCPKPNNKFCDCDSHKALYTGLP